MTVPEPTDRLQDMVLSLVSVAIGPVLVISGAAILGVPVGAVLSSDVLDVVQEHLPRLDAGLRDAERLVGLAAAGLGLLLSLGALIAVLASALLVVLLRLGRLDAGPAYDALEKLSPGFMRRTLVLTLTAQLVVTGAAATTSLQHDAEASAHRAEQTISQLDEDRTTTTLEETRSSAASSESPPDGASHTAPTGDPGAESAAEPPSAEHEEETMSPLFTPGQPEPETDRHQGGESRERADQEVTVRAGDSLWSIAAEELGPEATDWEIAERWPQWYEANQEAVGEDPGHLLPGTVLTAPSETADR